MSALRLTVGRVRDAGLRTSETLQTVHETPALRVEVSADVRRFARPDGSLLLVVGDVVGLRSGARRLSDSATALAALAGRWDPSVPDTLEGRFLLVNLAADGTCDLCGDRFGKRELYKQQTGAVTVLATGLDLLPVGAGGAELDQLALAHALTVYGQRPPKRHTCYRGVGRLGVGERVQIGPGGLAFVERPFAPPATAEYGERQLNEYADALLEAVRAAAAPTDNVVYLSSGWDSTALLACLVHLFGNGRVRAVIGRMQYAERSGVINQFEIDRARAMAEFFEVPLDVVEFDYRTRGPELLEQWRPLFRAHQIGSLVGLNHAQLASGAAGLAGGAPVFAGEISDGAHNLGFSQFVTIFHPVLDFRQYSDKMASYLFGPTFLRSMMAGTHELDAVYQFLKSRQGQAMLDEPSTQPAACLRQVLSSFFLRGSRFPMWSLRNCRVLTEAGREAYRAEMESTYLGRASREGGPETLYGWYLHLYNSFHWQGSTVVTLPLTAEALGLRPVLPYWDGAVQDFLSAMPESWGRGLDLNPTKHPLKWMLQHRVRYPMHLQVGPHSYLYDVDPGFSHAAEILYASSFAPFFRHRLKRGLLQERLSPEIFDLDYLRGVVDRYVGNEEVRGAEMTDLLNVCMVPMAGWYGDAD